MKKRMLTALLMITAAGLAACGKTNDKTASENTMTVAEEIAQGISQDVVPIEATMAIALSFQVPEGFRAAKGNTDNNRTFVSEQEDDNSYICYIRQEKSEAANYRDLTEDKYKEAVEKQLDTEVTITSMEQTESNGYDETILCLNYKRNQVDYEVTECIIFTERYMFTVVFAMDRNVNWKRQFEQSRDSIVLDSTLSMMENTGD